MALRINLQCRVIAPDSLTGLPGCRLIPILRQRVWASETTHNTVCCISPANFSVFAHYYFLAIHLSARVSCTARRTARASLTRAFRSGFQSVAFAGPVRIRKRRHAWPTIKYYIGRSEVRYQNIVIRRKFNISNVQEKECTFYIIQQSNIQRNTECARVTQINNIVVISISYLAINGRIK